MKYLKPRKQSAFLLTIENQEGITEKISQLEKQLGDAIPGTWGY